MDHLLCLPATGVDGSDAALILALLLLIGGAGILVAMRGRRSVRLGGGALLLMLAVVAAPIAVASPASADPCVEQTVDPPCEPLTITLGEAALSFPDAAVITVAGGFDAFTAAGGEFESLTYDGSASGAWTAFDAEGVELGSSSWTASTAGDVGAFTVSDPEISFDRGSYVDFVVGASEAANAALLELITTHPEYTTISHAGDVPVLTYTLSGSFDGGCGTRVPIALSVMARAGGGGGNN